MNTRRWELWVLRDVYFVGKCQIQLKHFPQNVWNLSPGLIPECGLSGKLTPQWGTRRLRSLVSSKQFSLFTETLGISFTLRIILLLWMKLSKALKTAKLGWWRDSALSWTRWVPTFNDQFAEEPRHFLMLPLSLIAETMDLVHWSRHAERTVHRNSVN